MSFSLKGSKWPCVVVFFRSSYPLTSKKLTTGCSFIKQFWKGFLGAVPLVSQYSFSSVANALHCHDTAYTSILIFSSCRCVHVSDAVCTDWSMIPWQLRKIVQLIKADDYISISKTIDSSIVGKEWCHDLAVSFRAIVPPRDLNSQQQALQAIWQCYTVEEIIYIYYFTLSKSR